MTIVISSFWDYLLNYLKRNLLWCEHSAKVRELGCLITLYGMEKYGCVLSVRVMTFKVPCAILMDGSHFCSLSFFLWSCSHKDHVHALNCHAGGFPIIHNEVQDFTANLTEVCHEPLSEDCYLPVPTGMVLLDSVSEHESFGVYHKLSLILNSSSYTMVLNWQSSLLWKEK